LGSMASIIIPAVLAVGVCIIGYSKKKQVQPE